jgi:hypothetical protein
MVLGGIAKPCKDKPWRCGPVGSRPVFAGDPAGNYIAKQKIAIYALQHPGASVDEAAANISGWDVVAAATIPLVVAGATGLISWFAIAGTEAATTAAGVTALAQRFGNSPERVELLGRVITSQNGLNVSQTVAAQAHRSFIPAQSILQTIGYGTRIPDPQGAVGHFMYRAAASFNNSVGRLEVLVHEATGQIRHVMYKSGAAP